MRLKALEERQLLFLQEFGNKKGIYKATNKNNVARAWIPNRVKIGKGLEMRGKRIGKDHKLVSMMLEIANKVKVRESQGLQNIRDSSLIQISVVANQSRNNYALDQEETTHAWILEEAQKVFFYQYTRVQDA